MREAKMTKREMVEAALDFAKTHGEEEGRRAVKGRENELLKGIEGSAAVCLHECLGYIYLLGFSDAFHIAISEASDHMVSETADTNKSLPF